MQLAISLIGIGFLFVAALFDLMRAKHQRTHRSLRDTTLSSDELLHHIKIKEPSLHIKGHGKLRPPNGMAHLLNRAQKRFGHTDAKSLLPAARWLSDSLRRIEESLKSAEYELRHQSRLPKTKSGAIRIMKLAEEMVAHSAGLITREMCIRCLNAYYEICPLSQQELHAFPAAIKMALLSLLDEMLCHVLFLQKEVTEAERIAALLAHESHINQRLFKNRSTAFWERLLSALKETDDAAATAFLHSQLKALDLDAIDLVQTEHLRQAENSRLVLNAVNSVKNMEQLPFDELLEDINPIHRILLSDSSDTYSKMDFESRQYYCGRVRRLCMQMRVGESALAQAACLLSGQGKKDGVHDHVGFYLLEPGGERALKKFLAIKRPFFSLHVFLKRHATEVYRFFLLLFAFLSFCILLRFKVPIYMALPALIISSQTTRRFLHFIVKKHLPARLLPRMQVDALTQENRCLVVIPTLISTPEQALSIARRLSVAYHANPDPHLHFMLLGDFSDSDTAFTPYDNEIIQAGEAALSALGGQITESAFFYVQRGRTFNARMGRYIGRERKRGALEMLNCYLTERDNNDPIVFSNADLKQLAYRYRYIITLDSDTLLPPGSAKRLIGALSHPLHICRKIDGKMRGMSLITPRIEISAATVTTPLALLFGGSGGMDPYNSAAQNLYQDIACRGSFTGKGIYTPDTFMLLSEGHIRPNTVLSHDLLEGELTGTAFAGDIVLYDSHPKSLQGYFKRLHRWTRGDWQLLPWLIPLFSPLSAFSRHKIWDNLLRSLVPIARLSLILLSLFFNDPWLLALSIFGASSETGPAFLLRLAFLPLEAYTMADAILRSLHRLFISKRNMLEWVTAAQGDIQGQPKGFEHFIQYACAGLVSLVSLLGSPSGLAIAALFAIAPSSIKKLNGPLEKKIPLSAEESAEAMDLAKKTFRFFDSVVSAASHFLPPDNLQLHPDKGLAARTSPTNIGLYLLSLIAAHELGFINANDTGQRIAQTIGTLEALEKWNGHLYNWYDTDTLEALAPRFVSSVDSGNLAACLFTVAQALRTLAPQMDAALHPLCARVDALAEQMDLSALFDSAAQLFYIGFDSINERFTDGHYDLLASEARLLSYVAIMNRQVPDRHWSRLGRTLIRRKGHTTLISWGGSSFEYLMPHLLLPYVRGTLLSDAAKALFLIQARHRKKEVFGVSESGYYAFDPSLNYQYKAFGLADIALNGRAESDVIAPYASILAFPLFPRSVLKNLRAMVANKWLGPFGLYEAVDFAPHRIDDAACKVVQSHMAHHQGMVLCALCNGLRDGVLQKYFLGLPKAKAYASLLEERAPGFVFRNKPPKTSINKSPPRPPASRLAEPNTRPVDAHLIYGGGTTLMTDAMGGGFMQTLGVMLSRFREDASIDSGIRFYVKDPGTDTLYGLTDVNAAGETTFHSGKAVFARQFGLFESRLTACVNPIDGAVLHFIEIDNPSATPLPLELADYFELSLNGQKADEAHPAFGDLFIETARLGKHALTARRRPKDKAETCKVLTHALISENELLHTVLQTDRGAFIGRNGSVHHPSQLKESIERSAGFTGAAITPCMAIRTCFILPAHAKMRFVYVTCYEQEQKLAPATVLERYQSVSQALDALSLSQMQALVTMRHLALNDFYHNLFGRLSGALLYSVNESAAAPCPLGQEGLWGLGISGDLPIFAVFVSKREHMALLKASVSAHSLYAMQGFFVDLALVVTELPAHDKPLMNAAIDATNLSTHPQHIHIIEHARLSCAQVALLHTAARVVFQGDMGSFATQLNNLITSDDAPTYSSTKEPAPALPSLKRSFFNGFGGFTTPDYDYAIDMTGGIPTPAPWSNLLCTRTFGSLVTESGFGFTYYKNSHLGRITPFFNDPVQYHSGERILCLDKELNTLFSPTLMPFGKNLNHRCTHSFGVTTYFAVGLQYECTLTVFTDEVYPVSVRQLRVKNIQPRTRHLRINHEVDFFMGNKQLVCIQKEPTLFTSSSPDFEGLAFLACLAPNYLNKEYTLKPDQQISVTFFLGAAEDSEAISNCIDVFAHDGVTNRLRAVKSAWLARLSKLSFALPDEKLNILMNKWLPYQTIASRLYARAGFYQAGGAIGFRDQLQDMLLIMHTDPDSVRTHLLNCAAHQYEQGDVQHWWHPERRGVRTRISDDLLFLPYITAAYIKRTGDIGILSEQVPYLSAPPLIVDERERYHTPPQTEYRENLLSHCLKAINHVRFSGNGLPLMQGGDWNDGMNAVGGESVWLALFMATVIRDFAPFCDKNEQQSLLNTRDKLLSSVNAYAWDGAWYARAFYESGESLGSQSSSACQIDSLSQSFAVLSGIRRDRASQALNEAYQRLFLPDIGAMQLLTPPFEPCDRPGYIAGYLPGIRENGGQYSHAVPWVIWAMKELGWKDRAYELLDALLPITHAMDTRNALRYRLEPYFMAGDIYTNKKQYGRGGWSLYTGSAAWLYTVVLEQLLGFEKNGDTLKMKPFIPLEWEDFTITFLFGQSTWRITASRDVPYPTLDGEKLTDGCITLVDDHRIHDARFRLA